MLTIENYKELTNKNFIAKSGQPGWIVGMISETPTHYQIVVMPWDSIAYSIAGALLYQLKREFNKNGYYEMSNNKNNRIAKVYRNNLTIHNFILELGIQTALNTN